MPTQKFVVKYPPSYDGELWIFATKEDNNQRTVEFRFSVAQLPGETVQDTLKRIAVDMQRVRLG